MSEKPIKCYIFVKPLIPGCRILYFELSIMQIQNTNTQIQCMHKANCEMHFFGKSLMQGGQKSYFELSMMQIQNTNTVYTQIQQMMKCK